MNKSSDEAIFGRSNLQTKQIFRRNLLESSPLGFREGKRQERMNAKLLLDSSRDLLESSSLGFREGKRHERMNILMQNQKRMSMNNNMQVVLKAYFMLLFLAGVATARMDLSMLKSGHHHSSSDEPSESSKPCCDQCICTRSDPPQCHCEDIRLNSCHSAKAIILTEVRISGSMSTARGYLNKRERTIMQNLLVSSNPPRAMETQQVLWTPSPEFREMQHRRGSSGSS
ncbi:hypothetical protein Fmac_015644 [Flemingia macrophylla]|uniref:Bowman-Birk serine protease inhibitors family domain-containing protein n=1 Tax=Flemingia macrophylla TaxID=520843 RepID=A0ABD1MF85_9FABA